MHQRARAPRGLALALTISALAATGAAAIGPTTVVHTGSSGDRLTAADLASRHGRLFLSVEMAFGAEDIAVPFRSVDGGSTWDDVDWGESVARESQVAMCGSAGVMVAREADTVGASDWRITLRSADFEAPSTGYTAITTLGRHRRPDVACIANEKVAIAWFKKAGDGFQVKLHVRLVDGEDLSTQTLTVGSGQVAKGLAVAASAQRVLVAWVDGDRLKVRRYAVGPAPDRTLTSVGTTTVVTHASVRDPRLALDGSRAVLAYQHQADLRIRRSTDRGTTWGGATTLRNNPYPSEVGTSPTSVDLVGKRIVVGALELAGVETLTAKGLGWFSANFGASWATRPKHVGGRTVAALFKDGTTQRYAEAWDVSVSQPDPERVRFRRD